VVLRSAGAESAQEHANVEVLPLPSSPCYTYVSPRGLAEEYGAHELADWGIGSDGREIRLFVAMGFKTRNSPSSGEGWAVAPARKLNGGRSSDGLRPAPLVVVDRSLAADDGTLQARAAAEAQRLSTSLEFGWIESTANLGIELYDVVTVDAVNARVVRIVESWDRGRLMQRLSLSEVGAGGVYQG
jgi:hypothetical protein